MNLATIEPALVTWAAALTGVEVGCVLWENAPRVRHNGRLVLLSWVSRTGVGIDSTAWTYAANADPLAEMTPSTEGNRELVVQVSVEVTTDQRPGYNAAALTERARARIRWPRALAMLEDAGLALATVGPATQADYPADGRLVSRSLFEVRFNAVASEADVDGRTSYIATVGATGTVKEPDGTDVPSTLQPE